MTAPNPHAVASRGAVRVPEPSAGFWALKILTTGVGETTSDFLVKTFDPALVVPAALLALVAVLAVQLRVCGYRPAPYWAAVLMVSVFGTMAADVLHVGLGVPYAASTAAFGLVLAAVFTAWWRLEGTLSVHDVTTPRRERLYWATVLTTFGLGTAAGDWTATSLGLGYLGSGLVFLVVFALPGLVLLVARRGAVATFWATYVVTRPLGASFADWAAVPTARGGLGLGPGPVSGCLLLVGALAVGLMSARLRAGRAAPAA